MKRTRPHFTLWDAISAKLRQRKSEKPNGWFTRRELVDHGASDVFDPFRYVESTPIKKQKKVIEDPHPHFKSRKVGLKPTREQKKVLDTFFAGAADRKSTRLNSSH